MNQIAEFFQKLLSTADWPPRWHCGRWTEFHGWFFILSDLLIWSAYFAIPLIILKFITRRKDVRFHRIYFLFAAFILACGSTHLLDAIMFWFPAYRLNALVKFFTGVISWITVFNLIRVLPAAFALKSPERLESEVEQRKAAEEKLRVRNAQLNEAQEIARIGHWEWDITHNKLSWSPMLLKIYGLPDTMEGLSYQEFLDKVHPDDKASVDQLIRESFEQKKFTDYYHRIVLPNGDIRILHARGEVIVNEKNETIKMIGTGQDVTEQKKAQQELLAKTQELESMNSELQKFAYIASHDLQEPLRKIITFTTLLEKEVKESAGEKGKVYIDKVVSASSRMQKLIDDILQFSRLSADASAFKNNDLNVILKQVLTDMEVVIEKKQVQIVSDKLPSIQCNASQIGQLFQNLLSNAIKFSKEGQRPEILIRCEILKRPAAAQPDATAAVPAFGQRDYRDKDHFCRIEIIDKGIGFDEIYLDRIFNLFQRLHGKNTFEGTGIGLAICKKVVDYHQGTITARSKPGEGSAFIIELPLAQQNYLADSAVR